MKIYKREEIEILKDFKFGKDQQYKVLVIQEKETGEAHLCWQNHIPAKWDVVVVILPQEGSICTALFK